MHTIPNRGRLFIALLATAFLASCGGGAAAPGLGSSDGGSGRGGTVGVGGSAGVGPGGGACQGPATDCTENAQCCSGRCAPVTGQAGVVQCTNACFADGVACTKALDCCSLGCFGGRCGGGLCKVESETCATNGECCSDICQGGECQVDLANRNCRPTGETCTSGSGLIPVLVLVDSPHPRTSSSLVRAGEDGDEDEHEDEDGFSRDERRGDHRLLR